MDFSCSSCWFIPVADLFAGTHISEALQWIRFLCHAALFVLFSVLRTLSLSASVFLFCCTLLSLSSYFYPSQSFQDVFFPFHLIFISHALSQPPPAPAALSDFLAAVTAGTLHLCAVLYRVCVGGGIKRIWDGRVEVRSRGKVKDKRIVEVKGKKGRWGWGVWHCSLHSAAIQLYLAEGMETFLSRATASLEADFFSGVKAGETEILTTSGTCQMSGNISCLWAQQRVRSLPFSGKSNTFQSWNGYSWIQRHIHKCLLFVKMPSEVRGLRGYICSWCAEGVLAVSAAEGWDDHIHNCILI